MNDTSRKEYIFASDFDQTLTFNDSGYVLSELVGIPTAEFERKATGMARLNLVQQGGELAYLLLHDPEFKSRIRKEHLYEVGKRIRLKENIALLYQILDSGIPGYHFDFYVLSAAPVEVIQSALEASFLKTISSARNSSTKKPERSKPLLAPPRAMEKCSSSINCRTAPRLAPTTSFIAATAVPTFTSCCTPMSATVIRLPSRKLSTCRKSPSELFLAPAHLPSSLRFSKTLPDGNARASVRSLNPTES